MTAPQQEFEAPPASDENPIRNYSILAMAGLLVVLMVQVRLEMYLLSGLSFIAGCLGIVFRWWFTPLLVLLMVVTSLVNPLADSEPRLVMRGFDLREWVLAGAMLTFIAAHYRLQALAVELLPQERWRRRFGKSKDRKVQVFEAKLSEQRKRPAHVVSPMELVGLVVSVPFFVMLGYIGFRLLPRQPQASFELHTGVWKSMVLLWVVGLTLLLASGVLQYLRYKRMPPAEARLIINDVLWQETRREQRRVARWLTWGWLRRRARRDTL